MSWSRHLAGLSDDDFRVAVRSLPEQMLNEHDDPTRDQFDKRMRPHLHGLHQGGMSKERLSELRQNSREEFYQAGAGRKNVANKTSVKEQVGIPKATPSFHNAPDCSAGGLLSGVIQVIDSPR